MQCVRFVIGVNARQQAALRPLLTSACSSTGFRGPDIVEPDPRAQFQRLYEELTNAETRNNLICADVLAAVETGRFPLVLTSGRNIFESWPKTVQDNSACDYVARWNAQKQSKRPWLRLSKRLKRRDGYASYGKYVGEGFDEPRLDTLFSDTASIVARHHRTICRPLAPVARRQTRGTGFMTMLIWMFRCCAHVRAALRWLRSTRLYTPSSGERCSRLARRSPLPIDPQWKRDYAASVRRLVRDGMDVPLANLFVHGHSSIPSV